MVNLTGREDVRVILRVKWRAGGAACIIGADEMRYGASWEAERGVKGCAKNQRGRQAVTRVLDWADHLVAEGNRLFKDTPFKGMWVISERVVVDVDHLSTHVCTFIPAPAAQSRIFQYLAPTLLFYCIS